MSPGSKLGVASKVSLLLVYLTLVTAFVFSILFYAHSSLQAEGGSFILGESPCYFITSVMFVIVSYTVGALILSCIYRAIEAKRAVRSSLYAYEFHGCRIPLSTKKD